jgi:hypothetical protein
MRRFGRTATKVAQRPSHTVWPSRTERTVALWPPDTNTGEAELTTQFWVHSLYNPFALDAYWEPMTAAATH